MIIMQLNLRVYPQINFLTLFLPRTSCFFSFTLGCQEVDIVEGKSTQHNRKLH